MSENKKKEKQRVENIETSGTKNKARAKASKSSNKNIERTQNTGILTFRSTSIIYLQITYTLSRNTKLLIIQYCKQ